MKQVLRNGLEWVSPDGETIEKTSFQWGEVNIEPGFEFEQIGSKNRSSMKIEGCKLQYFGRVGYNLLFSVNDNDSKSEHMGWFLCLAFVNNTTLLAQSTPNGFFDIRF